MDGFFAEAFVFAVAAIATLIVVPVVINKMKRRGLTGKDMNKPERQEVSELGGMAVMFGFSLGLTAALLMYSYLHAFNALNLTALLASFLCILLMGFIGIFDDLIGWKKGMRQYQHALTPLIAALPLMALNIGVTFMEIPFIGMIEFGVLYSLVIIPIGVIGASNAANMLAGLNGLEAGMGIIISATMLFLALFLGKMEVAILMLAMLGALLAFIKFNWFPARVFPGDSLTLMFGASIAAAAIIGDMQRIGIALFAIYFIELAFKARHKFQSECFGIPQKDGTLKANPKGGSLTHWVMRRGSFTEKQVVLIILGMQVLVSAAVIALFFARIL